MSTLPRHHSFALLRSTLLSIDQLITQWQQANRSETEALFQQLTNPIVEKALYVASPSLHQIWEDWRNGVISVPSLAAQLALWRYIIRMSSRSTPFGLFAGTSLIRLAERTCGVVPTDEPTENRRLDMGWLTTFIHVVEQQPTIRQRLTYRPNNSLYQLGNQYRYSDYMIINGQRAFFINSVDQDALLAGVLAHAQSETAGKTGEELTELIMQGFELSADAAAGYVDELIDAHLLISELEPGVTGEPPLDRLIRRLQAVPTAAPIVHQLETIRAIIKKPDVDVAELANVGDRMRRMLGDACPPGDVLQTDMVRSGDTVTISDHVVSQIGEQLAQLMPLRLDNQSTNLRTFAARYYTRYGGQAQPLLVVLDHESGVGYGPKIAQGGAGQSALLQQLTAPIRQPASSTGDRLDALRLKLLTNFLHTDQPQVITDEDLTAAVAPATLVARSWAALGELYGAEAIDKGDYQFLLKSASGPSGVSLMARFATSTGALAADLRRVTEWEAAQNPATLLAELVHLTAGRIGNVVCRPALHAYEIPYLTPSSVDEDHTLPLSDLWVQVPDGKTVELWSKKHGKQVLPRNTTAHNYHASDDVYRFLSDLSHQDESLSLRWSWGSLADQPALPRVTYKQIILARAQWTIKKRKWASASTMMTDLSQKSTLPRYVAMVEADNELLLDLEDAMCQQLVYAELTKRDQVRLVEWLATPSNCWLTRGGHRFTSELVIPFTQANPPLPVRQSPFRLAADSAVQRTFLPGSDWLYVKVYVGEQTADEILMDVVRPFVNEQYRAWYGRLAEQEGHSVKEMAELSSDTLQLIARLQEMRTEYPLEVPSQSDLITALLHMQCNRFFTNGQRLSEGIVYHFLARGYASKKARIRTHGPLLDV